VVDVDRPLHELEAIVAHNVFHRAVALGQPSGARLAEVEGTVLVNGNAVHRFDASEAAGDLAEAVSVIADTLGACGEQLLAGDRIIAGSLTAPVPVAAGDAVALDLGALGRVELRFAAER
jgi:2-keto-4-pentenoate hydratase